MTTVGTNYRSAYVTYVTRHVQELDPTATESAIARYLSEIDIMTEALNALDPAPAGELEPFTAEWREATQK